MVMNPPGWQTRKAKLLLELAWLKTKEKISGKLSGADQQRIRVIMRELMIKF